MKLTFFGNSPRLDVTQPVGPRIGLTGTSAMAIPTTTGPAVVLRFGYQMSGLDCKLKVGDDRDPQHGFRHIITVDKGGRLRLSGSTQSATLIPGRHYNFELRWAWTSAGKLQIQSLRIRENGRSDVVPTSNETRTGSRGVSLRIRHAGSDTSWFDSMSIAGN